MAGEFDSFDKLFSGQAPQSAQTAPPARMDDFSKFDSLFPASSAAGGPAPASTPAAPTSDSSGGFLDKLANNKGLQLAGKMGVDVGAMELGGAAGAALGGMTGPLAPIAVPAGAALGQAAGAALSSGAQDQLANYNGQQNKSQADILHDMGKNFMLALAGGRIAKGATDLGEASIPAIVEAGKVIGNKVSPMIKDTLSSALATVTGKAPSSFKDLFTDAGRVMGQVKQYVNGSGGDTAAAVGAATDDGIAKSKELLKLASDTLPQKWNQQVETLMATPQAAKMTVNTKDVFSDAAKYLEQKGFGQVVKDGDDFKFLPFSQKELTSRIMNDESAVSVGKESAEKVQELAKLVGQFSQIGEVSGPKAAKVMVKFNSMLSQAGQAARAGGDSSLEAVVDGITSGFKSGIGNQFEKAGLSDEYGKLSQLYADYGNSVRQARELLSNEKGGERLFGRLATDVTKNRTEKGMVDNLVELTGQKGQELSEGIKLTHSARDFIPWAPQGSLRGVIGATGVGKSAMMGAAVGSGIAGPVGAVVGGAAGALAPAAAMSPRMIGKQAQLAQYIGVAADHVGQLTAKNLHQLLTSDTAMTTLIKTIADAPAKEDAIKQQLLSGVDNHGK